MYLSSSYKDREGLAPAVYLNRYHGPLSSGANPAELVSSVQDAVRQASGTSVTRPKHSWQPSAEIDVQEREYTPHSPLSLLHCVY